MGFLSPHQLDTCCPLTRQHYLKQYPHLIPGRHVSSSAAARQSASDMWQKLKTTTRLASAHMSRTQPSKLISLSSREQIRRCLWY
ncbi:hypothetical protein Scep_022137 [Stephania cephalantha]|uniref:Uncharacterized protein n=1 Tax=Stephania cephalantha TaxID=152367 RepID=A0AAP0FDP9_9MAGN